MQGLIFQGLKEFIRKKLGFGFWDEIRHKAGVDTTIYIPVQAYPDSELLDLIRAIAEKLGIPVQSMLEEFGRFFIPGFLRSRAYLLDPSWGVLDILEHGPEILAMVEKKNLPSSPAAFLHCVRNGPNELTLRYNSPRKLCAFVKGIIKGLAEMHQNQVEIEEPRCMFHGHAECVFIVRILPDNPPDNLTTAESEETRAGNEK